MKFTANRRIMLEYLKTMISVVPKNSPVQELKGFLVEANEDDGHLYLTANNQEVAIQRKFKPVVESGGNFVMEAKMLVDILTLLGGDDVVFEELKPGRIEIKAERCVYTMNVLDGRIYPRPEIPFPDSTVHICGIKQMYSKTRATVGKDSASEALKGIHFNIQPNGFKAESCNVRDVAIATRQMNCGGSMDFTLPKQTLFYLASAAGDDDLEVGLSGPYVVFMKEGMLFSSRRLANEFVDVSKILNALQSVYKSVVEGEDFKNEILGTCDIASMGAETSYVKLDFGESKIGMSTMNEVGSGSHSVNCVMVEGSAGSSFYYPAADLKDIFKTVEGKMIVQLDKRGYLLVFDKCNQFMLTPMTQQSVMKQFAKIEERKKKPKAVKKTEEVPKAA